MAPEPGPGARALEDLLATLEQLKRSFARYFEGLERVAPLDARDAFAGELLRCQTLLRGNTALLFRYNALKASWLSQQTLWNRILAQIEAGTYPPHRQRAATLVKQAPKGAESRAPEPEAPAPPHPLARLHAAYVAALVQAGRPPPSLEAMAVAVAHQVAEVRARSGVRQVDIAVVMEQGLPTLQVTPKG